MNDDILLLREGLRDAPKISEQIGHLSVAWAHLEFRVFCIFSLLSGMPTSLARAIFYSQRTTRARLDILLAIAPLILTPRRGTRETADLKKLLGNIGQLAGDRNKYVHDPWGGRREKPKRAYQLRLTGTHARYARITRREIERLTDKIETKAAAMRRLYIFLQPKMPALHKKLAQQRSLSLTLATATTDTLPKRKRPRISG
jgi:hypothetical protein